MAEETPRKDRNKTAPGASILEIALQLKKQDKSISFDEHKKKAEEIVKAQQQLVYGGSKLRHNLLSRVLGKTLGGATSRAFADKTKQEHAANTLAEYHESKEKGGKAERILTKVDNVEKKVDALTTNVQEIKATKVAAPAPVTPTKHVSAPETAQNMKDVASALKSMGLKKDEIMKALQQVTPSDNISDMINQAFRAHDKIRNPEAQKLKKAEVPAAVEAAKAEIKPPEPPKMPTAHPPKPEVVAEPPKAAVATAPAPTPQKAQGKKDQEEVEKVKKAREILAKEKKKEEQDKKVQAELEDIKNTLTNNGIVDLIAIALGKLISSIFSPILKGVMSLLPQVLKFLGPATLVIGAGVAAYYGMKKILEHFGYTGEGIGGALSSQDEDVKASNLAHPTDVKSTTNELNAALKGTGYTALGAGKYKNDKGDVFTKNQLPGDVQAKIKIPEPKADAAKVKKVAAKAEAMAPSTTAGPPATSSMSADRLTAATEDMPPDGADEPTNSTPVVMQDNRKTIVQQGGNSAQPLIKVRNDEPTIGDMAAGIFDHPFSYGGVFRT